MAVVCVFLFGSAYSEDKAILAVCGSYPLKKVEEWSSLTGKPVDFILNAMKQIDNENYKKLMDLYNKYAECTSGANDYFG
ncbi:DgyrCDS7282 [Dimorphilus gyrociliatus]|uniref:DgyrCDS7282 n=1 Tax=Dimorphilus gyrociliatus TaxID=2664684 RepID=A0A7I8VQK0_9ANNE|nr:DgyrCDS7282 [Dimorphilus gyrociliatus]